MCQINNLFCYCCGSKASHPKDLQICPFDGCEEIICFDPGCQKKHLESRHGFYGYDNIILAKQEMKNNSFFRGVFLSLDMLDEMNEPSKSDYNNNPMFK